MTRYNSGSNYNSSTNYGVSAAAEGGLMMWQLLFDWNNDGIFDSTNESNRLINLSIDRGRQDYLASQGRGFDHMRPGRLRLTLDNYDRRYDPRYATSPLYPNVKPGRRVYLAVVDLSTNITYPMFVGRVDDIAPMFAPGGGEVQLECVDYMAVLNDQSLSFAAASQNITLANAFQILLTDAQFPGQLALDTDTQPVIVFGVTDKNAGQVAHDLADAGMGVFFVDRSGTAKFYARSHTYPTATALDQAVCLNDPVVTQPWEDVYNHVTAVAMRPIRKQPAVIYMLAGPVQLSAGVPYVMDVDYKSSFDVQLGTYAAWTDKTGTGTSKTANTTVTPALGYNGGTVTVTCTADAYLTKLEIRGRMWDFVDEKKVSEDATSQTEYGMRRFVLDTEFLQDPNYAANHAGIIKTFAKDDRESVTVQIEGREDIQFGFDLMTPVAFTAAYLDISATYYVMGIKHNWQRFSQSVVTTLHLSKIITDSTAVTPAEILNEPAEAPLGYEDPGGDTDDTLNALGFEEIGDLLVSSDAIGGYDNLPVGTNGYVLTADSAEPLGVKWAAATSGGGSGSLPPLLPPVVGETGTGYIYPISPGLVIGAGEYAEARSALWWVSDGGTYTFTPVFSVYLGGGGSDTTMSIFSPAAFNIRYTSTSSGQFLYSTQTSAAGAGGGYTVIKATYTVIGAEKITLAVGDNSFVQCQLTFQHTDAAPRIYLYFFGWIVNLVDP